ncbi:ParB/Srx family N-terminal domain-containing protein [Paracoccus litorisediminis]|uniref:Chromosome partitioning protein ParB n=1 Tax=Paracoccus litorisediminis TaxID=2006130 RepID=A0A844HMT6_9RHOB|nr:ParB N-terminal domain-containing protein [Paracoccus litorisediminis]MTH61186.1 chromosome partitioning protein ParB [Paracoccus litorisediminis]
MTTNSPAIEIWPIEDLIPYEANAKKHPEAQIEKLATTITKMGWTQPIVVWGNGEIIAGHGRRLAALKIGLPKVPVIVRRDLTKAEADALRLADNRVTSTEYDQGLIQEELIRLNSELLGTDLSLTDMGFDEKEITFVLADLGEMDEDFFATDISAAVEEQKVQAAAEVEATDEIAAPVVDALGFKRVTIAQSRAIRDAMGKVEAKTGKKGVEALIAVLEAA